MLPAMSAAMAVAARRAVGAERAVRRWWLSLAALGSGLAGVDLVVAELLLCASAGDPSGGGG